MHFLEAHELAARIRDGRLSPVEATTATLERIEQHDPTLNTYSMVLADEAMAEAQRLTEELAHGRPRGPLHGVPVSVKDLCWVEGTPATAGTIALAQHVAPADGTVVARLRAAGAVVVGKTKMSEAALAAHHPDLGTPLNPWDHELWIGASSSGAAAATAAGLCHAAIGSDTGGSIRFPSAAAGLTGLKPTFGRVSRAGTVEFAGSLDHIGPMARSVRDVALVFDAIAGPDPADPTTLIGPAPRLADACEEPVPAGLKVGVDPAFMAVCDAETTRVLEDAIAVLEAMGAQVVPVHLPDVDQTVEDWTPQCAVEAAVVHAETFAAAPDRYGDQVRELLERGLATPATDLARIAARRRDFAARWHEATREVDVLLLQVTGVAGPTAAWLDELGVGPVWRDRIMKATCPVNAVGVPSLTLPGGRTTSGAPVGFQLVGGLGAEALLVRVGHAFQEATEHHRVHPTGY